MAYRRLPDEPTSRLATWALRIALFSIPVVLLTIIVIQFGLLEAVPAMATFAGVLGLSVLAILCALASFVVIWREGYKGFGISLLAMLIGIATLAYPTYLEIRRYRLPPIFDVTTDPIDPPRFEAIARLRPRDANPLVYAGLRSAELQRAAYDDIEPLVVTATPQIAYEAAYQVMIKRKWSIIANVAPQPGRRDGRIEAVARTLFMGFREDVVVRIRATSDGTRIDMRSSSRYGLHDYGSNASRVRALSEDIDDQVESLAPEKPAEPVKKTAKNQPKGIQKPAKR